MPKSKTAIHIRDFEFQKINLELIKNYEDGEKWYVEGFASSSNIDEQGDLITPEALDKCVKNEDFSTYSTVLHNHKPDEEIGKVEEYDVRTHNGMKKLWVKILISKTVPKIWQRVKEGVLNKFSIRASVVDSVRRWSEDVQKFVTHILEMKAKEVSLVGLPANPEAEQLNFYVAKALKELSVGGDNNMSKEKKDIKKEEEKKDEAAEEKKDDAATDEKKDNKKEESKDDKKEDTEKADDSDEVEVELEVADDAKVKKDGESDGEADSKADGEADGDAAKEDKKEDDAKDDKKEEKKEDAKKEDDSEEKQEEGAPPVCKLANQKSSTVEGEVKLCPVAYKGTFGDPDPSKGRPSDATACPRVKGGTHTCPYLVAAKEEKEEGKEDESNADDAKSLSTDIANAIKGAVKEAMADVAKELKGTVADIVKDELSNKKFKVKIKGRKSLLKDEEKEADSDEVKKGAKDAASDLALSNSLFHRTPAK